ncbi:MAG TPA: DEAD/DEAH box helicase, partial [Candidatus Tectomicrobia bacterium]
MTFLQALNSLPGVASHLPLTIRGVVAGAKGYLLARLFVEHAVPMLVVTPDVRQRDLLYNDLRCFLAGLSLTAPHWQGMAEVVYCYEPRPPEPMGSLAYQQQRALTTYQPLWRLLDKPPVVVVTAAASLRYRVVPADYLYQCLLRLCVGMHCAFDSLVGSLVERGYRRVSVVETVGEFSVRGGILDVFSPGQSHPVRVEFFGDEVETIRTFEVRSQVSVETLQETLVAPMHPLHRRSPDFPAGVARLREWLQQQGWGEAQVSAHLEYWENQPPAAWPWGLEGFFYDTLQSPLAYLPASSLLCGVDAEDIFLTLQQLPPADAMQLGEDVVPLPEAHVLDPGALAQQIHSRTHVALVQYGTPSGTDAVQGLQVRGAPQFFGVLERFITQVRQWLAEGYGLFLLCRFPLEAQRMQDLLAEYELGSHVLAACAEVLSDEVVLPGAILLGVGEVSQGFLFPEAHLVVLREEEIFGEKKRQHTAVATAPRHALVDLGALRPGDRVVHIDYGIGLYRGMTFLDVGPDRGEFIELEYADGAKLYVPTYRLSMVQRYTGGDGDEGPLDRLGGTSWARTKERVKASLLAMAGDLVKLHATRQTHPGYGFSRHTALHREFESGFEYVETEDQLQAIQQVMADMERPRAMDRLVCGDVGYGKTEVAMRAAFKAAYDGKQVAVLVPTTVLAQQHYETFRRRFASYPVHIAVLSRLRSRQEQQHVLDDLHHGRVDIVIGTHRLLQPDVQFKELGLLVVDEEHRFGVGHKERIKQLSSHVDVLTLTATPIPRSLHMSLVGLRDFSIIETPPEGRSAIETRVAPFAEETIQQAIRQELARGGQVFFVQNHI